MVEDWKVSFCLKSNIKEVENTCIQGCVVLTVNAGQQPGIKLDLITEAKRKNTVFWMKANVFLYKHLHFTGVLTEILLLFVCRFACVLTCSRM